VSDAECCYSACLAFGQIADPAIWGTPPEAIAALAALSRVAKDENTAAWFDAIWKATYHRIRKTIFNVLRWKERRVAPTKVIPQFPKLTERYRTRTESDGTCLAMFERSGTKVLSPLALSVLPLLDGYHTVEAIFESCRGTFPSCTREDIREIVHSIF
jgi:hypothetical protein